MWIKICGTTNLVDAQLAVDLGADALGFIFAGSKRRVEVPAAAAITMQLPTRVERVGVFTEAQRAEIVPTVYAARLTAVQLHMRHDAALTRCLHAVLGDRVRLIQVVPFYTGDTDPEVIRESFERPLTEALADPTISSVLLDTAKAGQSGGLGETFSWRLALPAIRAAQARAQERLLLGMDDSMSKSRQPYELSLQPYELPPLPKLLLAGGLHAANVAEAIGVLEPWGVDVVSGVEAEPGRKDPERLAAFIAAARRAQRD